MKINLEEISKLERRLNIEVPFEKVSEAFEKAFKKIQNSASIKGFRKGKAPLATIKGIYRDHVQQDVLNNLVSEFYTKALEERSLDPINYPNIKIDSFNENGPFQFTAEFEIRPDIQLQQYVGLPVDREQISTSPEQVDKVLENLRSNHGEMVPVIEDRPARVGDFSVIDFEGTMNGAPVENAKGSEQTLELGSNSFIPGFEEGIIGMKIGDTKTLDLRFPETYHAEQLAGKDVKFQVTLKSLKQKRMPELNDEFAKTLGIDSLERLKEMIAEDNKKSEQRRIDDEFKGRLMKVLVDRNPVDVPKSMHEEQKKLLIEDMKERFQSQGLPSTDFSNYAEKWDADFSKSATFVIQSSFLVQAIAAKENLRATDDEVNAKIEEYAVQAGIEPARVRSFYSKPDQKSRLRFKMTEDKVVAFLAEKANVREVPKSELKD